MMHDAVEIPEGESVCVKEGRKSASRESIGLLLSRLDHQLAHQPATYLANGQSINQITTTQPEEYLPKCNDKVSSILFATSST